MSHLEAIGVVSITQVPSRRYVYKKEEEKLNSIETPNHAIGFRNAGKERRNMQSLDAKNVEER
jgi:hypothetical protein